MAAELASSLVATDADRLLQAESVVRGYCGWHIAPERTQTQIIRTSVSSAAVVLPSLHVTAVALVTRDGVTLVEGDDYSWSEAGVLVFYRLPYFAWSDTTALTEIVVTFTHGYAEVPPEVTGVVQAIATRALNGPALVQVGQVRYSDDSGAARSSDSAVLNRYRLPALP